MPDANSHPAKVLTTDATLSEADATEFQTITQTLIQLGQQLAATRILCFGCVVERHLGQRTEANPAITIVNGQATCLDHLQLVDGPVIPGRTASGLILGNGG